MEENPVRATTLEVVRKAKHVWINEKNIEKLAKQWVLEKATVPKWSEEIHFKSDDPEKLFTYFIAVDSMNFCFWSETVRWVTRYNGKRYTGAFALAIALRRHFETYPERLCFEHLQNISMPEFLSMFAGEGELLLLKERWDILREVSRAMLERYSGSACDLVYSCGRHLYVFVPKVVAHLPSFKDESTYRGTPVYFWKRAQLLAADINEALLKTTGRGFDDLEYLTGLADYRVPQVLAWHNILGYSPELKDKIVRGIRLTYGSEEEVELRASMIWVVEKLQSALKRCGQEWLPIEIDNMLWMQSKKLPRELPHHRTLTTNY